MSRRRGFVHSVVQAQRAAAALERTAARAARERERERRAMEREALVEAKERERLYHESRNAEAAALTKEVEERLTEIQALLSHALSRDHSVDFGSLKRKLTIPTFKPGDLAAEEPAPSPSDYLPPKPFIFARFLPGARERHGMRLREARERYDKDVAAHVSREAERTKRLNAAKAKHEVTIEKLKQHTAAQHAEVAKFEKEYAAAVREAVAEYCEIAVKTCPTPEHFPDKLKIAYLPESKQVVTEINLPTSDIVPEALTYRYVKSKDDIVSTARPLTERKHLYATLIANVTLRTLHILFSSDKAGHVDSVVFNGCVDTIDKATGHEIRKCLVTLRTTREAFTKIELSRVDPEACLKALNAEVSKSPTELVPVRPVLNFDMVDPRFIEETDVLSTLDQRPNLMKLSPSEFESLITNLFEKMGLETRLTQASRDGGVDCVAFDPRPIFGGKVVIQAKRYKNTVGVSAVRDLFGTVQNEGASKGILVTTSGFGKASFDFANGKPLELLAGSNLLYLLATHAGINAKIEPPDDWTDPEADSGE